MTNDRSLPFSGGIMFLQMPGEEAEKLRVKMEHAKALRHAHNAKRMKTLPEGALTLDFKRVLAGEIMGQFIAKCDMPEGRLDAMTEDEIDGVIVAAVELEETCDEYDHEAFLAAMRDAKRLTLKP